MHLFLNSLHIQPFIVSNRNNLKVSFQGIATVTLLPQVMDSKHNNFKTKVKAIQTIQHQLHNNDNHHHQENIIQQQRSKIYIAMKHINIIGNQAILPKSVGGNQKEQLKMMQFHNLLQPSLQTTPLPKQNGLLTQELQIT